MINLSSPEEILVICQKVKFHGRLADIYTWGNINVYVNLQICHNFIVANFNHKYRYSYSFQPMETFHDLLRTETFTYILNTELEGADLQVEKKDNYLVYVFSGNFYQDVISIKKAL